MASIYILTIDPVAIGITKPVDRVYIKNLYVDTDDTHIRTAPFEYSAEVMNNIAFAELPATTIGSIYQIQLFGSEGMVFSVFFGMPELASKLSELDIYTAYPPRGYYPEASVSWGQLKGLITDQTDLTAIMFTKVEGQALKTELGDKIATNINGIGGLTALTGLHTADLLSLAARATSSEQAISGLDTLTKAHTAKNTAQDGVISANDVAINLRVDGVVSSTNAEIALRAKTADVNTKNATQDTAINLRATIATVDAKNVLQDTAIGNNATAITAIQAYAPQNRTISATGDATWSVTFDGSANVTGAMTVRAASTTAAGIVQLNNTVASTSITQAATANAVKLANDKAAAAIPTTQKGAVNGVASLGADGKVTPTQLPAVVPIAWGNITGSIAAQTDLAAMYFKVADFDAWVVLINAAIDSSRLQGDFYGITTTSQPNTFIDTDGTMKRSTATTPTLGTAATKNVGEAVGNVMQVGAFGVGRSNDARHKDSSANRIAGMGLSLEFNHTNLGGGTYGSFLNLGAYVDSTGYEGINRLIVNPRGMWVQSTIEVDDGLAYDEPREVVLKDPTGNLPVASIQAGIGAPKIAYKKLTGVLPSSGVLQKAHGLNRNKILDFSAVIERQGIAYPAGSSHPSSSYQAYLTESGGNIIIAIGSGSSFGGSTVTILITYEAD